MGALCCKEHSSQQCCTQTATMQDTPSYRTSLANLDPGSAGPDQQERLSARQILDKKPLSPEATEHECRDQSKTAVLQQSKYLREEWADPGGRV